MPLIKISTIFNIDLEFEIAPVYKRILAYLLDFTVLLLYIISMKYLYYNGVDVTDDYMNKRIGMDILTISLPMLLYSFVSEVLMHGQTLGKKLFNIRVISLSGGEPSISQYLTRWMFRVFEWPFFFGYIMFSGTAFTAYIIITLFLGLGVAIIIATTRKNQRLGDVAANTVVVDTRSDYSVNDTVFMDIKEENYEVKFPEVLRLSDRDINTIKNVLDVTYKNRQHELSERVALKVQNVLNISTDMPAESFLQKLLSDYNYLATQQVPANL